MIKESLESRFIFSIYLLNTCHHEIQLLTMLQLIYKQSNYCYYLLFFFKFGYYIL